MHKFMSAVGFQKCQSKQQLDMLVTMTMRDFDEEKQFIDKNGRRMFQIRKNYAEETGIMIIGEITENNYHNVQFVFPYIKGSTVTTEDEIQIQKFAEKDAYAGISEDYNIGISMIFYLINIADYVADQDWYHRRIYKNVKLSALSTEGKIIFGIKKDEEQILQEMTGETNRNYLIQRAKNGDMDAMESLTLEDIDTYSMVAKRALKEDVYSIVDTTFMPYGVESDQYSIIGNIVKVKEIENCVTKEKIYILDLICNGINIRLGINKANLYGIPKIGYRFKGNIWMQGILDTNKKSEQM